MELITIASGSDANCYLLRASDGETLMLECGEPFEKVEEALGYDIKGLRHCLVSHKHKDHSKYIRGVMRMGIKVLALEEVFTVHGLRPDEAWAQTLPFGKATVLAGAFSVRTVPLQHGFDEGSGEPVQCLGFVIEHGEMGRLFFATDTSMFEPSAVPPCEHLMIECNYADDILQYNVAEGTVTRSNRERIALAHMSLGGLKRLLRRMDLSVTRDITLLHLSSRNGNAPRFTREIEEAVKGRGIQVNTAHKGFPLKIGKEPY